jgi:RES domain-containing protein
VAHREAQASGPRLRRRRGSPLRRQLDERLPRAVYTSSTVALATLELLVHLGTTRALVAYSLFEVTIPASAVTGVDVAPLPKTWRDYPAPPRLCAIGDAWLDAKPSAALRVPSAAVGTEFNFILNPGHDDFPLIAIGAERPYFLDPRLPRSAG